MTIVSGSPHLSLSAARHSICDKPEVGAIGNNQNIAGAPEVRTSERIPRRTEILGLIENPIRPTSRALGSEDHRVWSLRIHLDRVTIACEVAQQRRRPCNASVGASSDTFAPA